MKTFTLRLKPDQDLSQELHKFVQENNIRAGFVMTCVGSLKKAALRLANQEVITTYEDKFEIVALVGTLAQQGFHLHIALSDKTGRTIGGHLPEKDCIIYTTAEIVIGEIEDLVFSREYDEQTTYEELVISKR